ncbi:hypothetical protein AYO21_02542 [Fonsecaea monophora]|uniref:NADP-dependent oxidoreductase domain-containing protein n=1 Tax=Fonsecaea monophora TaxID=254056 RepID=A0A177FHS7_9EURO|nr:hypothetical protein AYO21_02542 [Fonsecaea monophora]OAG43256.1 hypothetical protein AYO21_02542 [Fonsecaea monophora]
MSTGPALKILLGLANVGRGCPAGSQPSDTTRPEQVNEYLDAFYAHGGRELDTARDHSPHGADTSEARLGHRRSRRAQEILESLDSSIEALKQPKVNVGYLHVPDRATPFEETAKALNEACKAKACRISQPTRWKDS